MVETPNEPILYLNGDFVPLSEAKISVLDQGFLLGDGVFDVVSAWRGSRSSGSMSTSTVSSIRCARRGWKPA